LRERKGSCDQVGLRVVPIGQGSPKELQKFIEGRNLPFEMLTDPERDAYRAYGLERGSAGQIFSRQVVVEGLKAASEGHVMTKVVGDVMQLPGSFVIEDGTIVFAHRGQLSSDVGSPDDLIAAVGKPES
jgi:peroxiredoxin